MLPQADGGGSTRSWLRKTLNEAAESGLVKISAS